MTNQRVAEIVINGNRFGMAKFLRVGHAIQMEKCCTVVAGRGWHMKQCIRCRNGRRKTAPSGLRLWEKNLYFMGEKMHAIEHQCRFVAILIVFAANV